MGPTRQQRAPAWIPPTRTTASPVAGGEAAVAGPGGLVAGRSQTLAPTLLDHPMSRAMRWTVVQGLQQTHGNAHVARLLQRLPILTLPGCQTTEEDAGVLTEEEQRRLEAIKQIMAASPTGVEALAVLDKHQVKIAFDAAGGSEYDPNTNEILIDANESDARAALALVHELNHARYEKEGLAADVMTLSREEYIKRGVEEEAESVVKSIEAKIELEGTTIDVSQTAYPFEAEYRTAYQQAIEAARAKDPAAPEDTLKKLGRAAGKARVIKGYMDGEIVGSRSGKTYPEAYGEFWDQKHQQPGGK